jgi:sodium-dependent dicarboxylate transporter 2/3/5
MSEENVKLSVSEAEASFDRKRKSIGFFLGPALAIIVYLIPIEGLKPAAHGLLAIMSLVCTWWITEPIPIPVTSLMGPVLATVTGIATPTQVFAQFANPTIYLFMGGFILATGMTAQGLDKRFAYGLLSMKWVGSNPKRIMLAMGLATTLVSGWMSNTATAAMVYPIGLGLLFAIKEMQKAAGKDIDLHTYKYATGLMLVVAYSASIGGVLTPIGTPPNLITVGFLEQMAKIKISFFQWMVWGSLAMVLYFCMMYVVLSRMFPADVQKIEGAEDLIRSKRAELGSWRRGEINALISFIVAVTLWVSPGVLQILGFTNAANMVTKYFSEAVVAMVAGLLLFIMPVDWSQRKFTISWKEAKEGIDWGTLLLFGGGLSMGSMMFSSGLSKWIGEAIVQGTGVNSQMGLIIVFCILSIGMSELTSHTASTNMICPLGITAAMSAGIDPVPVAVAIALASSLGFMLPVSTPPNAIVYGSGYVPITQMIKSGFILDVIGIAIFTLPICIYLVPWVLSMMSL